MRRRTRRGGRHDAGILDELARACRDAAKRGSRVYRASWLSRAAVESEDRDATALAGRAYRAFAGFEGVSGRAWGICRSLGLWSLCL
jgi:hypothetical protein